jgi:HlyD family secretion protein
MKKIAGLMLIVVIAGMLASCAGANAQSTTTKAAAGTQNTATVQRGNLTATVNAAGNISAHQQVALNFGQTGTVQKVNVKAGDRVKAGQVLASLDTSDLQLQLDNANVNLKVAQNKLAQTKTPSTAQDIANARSRLEAAQASYNKLAAGPNKTDLAAAQASVASAQAAYDAAVKSAAASGTTIDAATAQYQKALAALQQAQAAYDKVATAPNIGARPESTALQSATIDYNQAKANYEASQATTGSDAKSKTAQALSQLQQAQASLVKLQANENDLISSKAQVDQAKNDLDKILAGPDAATLDNAQQQVAQAEISVRQAENTLQHAQIVAPFDGTVTVVNIVAGQATGQSGTAGAIQLADLANLEIIAPMAEVDVSKIKPNQTAQITLDALPNANLTGVVTLVAPAGVQSQGVVNYPVTVVLKDPTPDVKTGMTANVNIITDQRNDVLMVPNRAVRTVGRQKMATVLFEGRNIDTPVVTGMSGDTQTEIVSGLKEGDVVVIGTTTTAAPRGFGGAPGGPAFGGGGPRGD